MANIVLRANIADRNVNIEYKVLPLPLSSNEIVDYFNPTGETIDTMDKNGDGFISAEEKINAMSEITKTATAESVAL